MISKNSLSILFLGLAFCCFLQSTTAQNPQCELRFYNGPVNGVDYIRLGGSHQAPFEGWRWLDAAETIQEDHVFTGLKGLEAYSCDYCFLTIYSTTHFSGRSQVLELYDATQYTFPFCVKSYNLECFGPEEEEPEEEEEVGSYFEMTPEQANTPEVRQIRTIATNEAITRDIAKGLVSQGQYQITEVRSSQYADVAGYYSFDVMVSNDLGENYNILSVIYYTPQAWDLKDWISIKK